MKSKIEGYISYQEDGWYKKQVIDSPGPGSFSFCMLQWNGREPVVEREGVFFSHP